MPIFRAARAAAVAATLLASLTTTASACSESARSFGLSRIAEIDATGGPVFGLITKQQKESRFLGAKEAVLTFDDGPLPGVTRAILDTLDQFCAKATFFSVGRMAAAYPESVREILKRGHTLGTHTWSHPMSLPRLSPKQARDQIESGFAAVSLAAGQPIAPFFRFPGLNDSGALVQHLGGRNIATFTVDVVSNDSYIADTQRLIDRTLAQLEEHQGGIVLFHDIKAQTARALPTILSEMKRRGYRIVHMTSKHPFAPDPAYVAAVSQHIVDKKIGPQRPALLAVVDAPVAPAPVGGADLAREPAAVAAVVPAQATPVTPKDGGAEPSPARVAGAANADAAVAPTASTARAVVARPKAAVRPAPAGPTTQIEVVAGTYPNPAAAKPQALPPIAAATAPSRPRALEPSWQDVQRVRLQESGN